MTLCLAVNAVDACAVHQQVEQCGQAALLLAAG
jgi:hypothetical protein